MCFWRKSGAWFRASETGRDFALKPPKKDREKAGTRVTPWSASDWRGFEPIGGHGAMFRSAECKKRVVVGSVEGGQCYRLWGCWNG